MMVTTPLCTFHTQCPAINVLETFFYHYIWILSKLSSTVAVFSRKLKNTLPEDNPSASRPYRWRSRQISWRTDLPSAWWSLEPDKTERWIRAWAQPDISHHHHWTETSSGCSSSRPESSFIKVWFDGYLMVYKIPIQKWMHIWGRIIFSICWVSTLLG